MTLYDIAYAASILLAAALLAESIEIARGNKQHMGFWTSAAFFIPSSILFFYSIIIQNLILGIIGFFGIVFGISNGYIALEEEEEDEIMRQIELARAQKEKRRMELVKPAAQKTSTRKPPAKKKIVKKRVTKKTTKKTVRKPTKKRTTKKRKR